MLKKSKSQIDMNDLGFTLCLKNAFYNFCCHFATENNHQGSEFHLGSISHILKRNSSKLCKAKFISFRNKKNRDVCGTISTWHSLAHRGNRQETYGVAA